MLPMGFSALRRSVPCFGAWYHAAYGFVLFMSFDTIGEDSLHGQCTKGVDLLHAKVS